MERLIVIGGSAGSFKIVSDLISALPADYPGSLIICLHRLKSARTGFKEALSINSNFHLKEPYDKERIEPSCGYLVPANYHLMVDFGHIITLSIDILRNHSRPSIDISMESVAEVFTEKAVGILLSGANTDGALGMKAISENGGLTLVQDPVDAEIKTMPESALKIMKPDRVISSKEIIEFLLNEL